MRFLVDAHLPRRLALRLREAGHDAIHTLDLPNQNRTKDSELLALADSDLAGLIQVLERNSFVELSRTALVVHA